MGTQRYSGVYVPHITWEDTMTDVPGTPRRPPVGWYMGRNGQPRPRRWDGSWWTNSACGLPRQAGISSPLLARGQTGDLGELRQAQRLWLK